MTDPVLPGGYIPGATHSRTVAAQLAERRESFRARWARDPGREASLVLLFLLVLATLFVAAFTGKVQSYARLGGDDDATYWMESAQRFRYVEMVAAGEGIPAVDRRMQWPDGYPTRRDTIGQEALYGSLAARDPSLTVAESTRLWTRLFASAGVLAMAWLGWALTRRRDAALLAAALYGLALPVVERGNGAVLFREDLAFPLLIAQVAALATWARRPSWGRALVAGVLLAGALLLWKVVTFYALLVVGLMAGAWWLGSGDPREIGRDTLILFVPPALAALAPLSLQYDHFLTSTPLLAAVCVGLGASLASRLPRVPVVLWPVLVVLALAGVRAVLPSESGYEHAWETILAKIRTLDRKPLDPGELSFHARHYWTGNYESPTLRRLLRDWPWLAVTAIPGLLVMGRELLRRTTPGPSVRPPPTQLLQGEGPLDPLPPLLALFVLWMTVGFLGVYLLFSKLALFAAVALSSLGALGFAAPRRLRLLPRLAILLGAVLVGLHGLGAVPSIERLAMEDVRGDAEGWSETVVYSPGGFSELVDWVEAETGPEEAVLASFQISPFLLTYAGRPTVLHCFFEGDLLDRLQEIVLARFESEQELWEVARRYGASWYVHEAQFALRTDPRMSQRYVADAMEWPAGSATVAMQYAPETLTHFELAWENQWFRVFRVLPEGERARNGRSSDRGALFDRELFAGLFGDPLGPLREGERAPDDLLYAVLKADSWMRYAAGQVDASDPARHFAEQEYGLQRAAEVAPFLAEPHRKLARLYRGMGRGDRMARHQAEAARLDRVAAGREAMRPGDLPAKVPRVR